MVQVKHLSWPKSSMFPPNGWLETHHGSFARRNGPRHRSRRSASAARYPRLSFEDRGVREGCGAEGGDAARETTRRPGSHQRGGGEEGECVGEEFRGKLLNRPKDQELNSFGCCTCTGRTWRCIFLKSALDTSGLEASVWSAVNLGW